MSKTRTQQLNDKPMLPWAGVALLIGALTTGGGLKLVDTLRPRTGERLSQIELTLKMMERDLFWMARSMSRVTSEPPPTNGWINGGKQ